MNTIRGYLGGPRGSLLYGCLLSRTPQDRNPFWRRITRVLCNQNDGRNPTAGKKKSARGINRLLSVILRGSRSYGGSKDLVDDTWSHVRAGEVWDIIKLVGRKGTENFFCNHRARSSNRTLEDAEGCRLTRLAGYNGDTKIFYLSKVLMNFSTSTITNIINDLI